jgi:hypothetical protein
VDGIIDDQYISDLSFPILNDRGGDAAIGFGIRWGSDDLEAIEREFGANLIHFVGGLNWILPMQARYVVSQDGVIAYADIAFSYDERSEPTDVLPVLARLRTTQST